MEAVRFSDVWEMYRIKFNIDGKPQWENYWVLRGISFNVAKGETLGIIGENGSGKSTILKLIMGMLSPDRGSALVSGKVSGLLELGAGFQPELTGKENIYLSASLFGLDSVQTNILYEKIVEFASLGKFIFAPVKCYSQGMFVRLAFAIAIHVNPDILLIDDTLSVGDEFFQRKCIKKIFELKNSGKTIIFVTHDMNMLRRMCDRALFVSEGRLIKDASAGEVIPFYSQFTGVREGLGLMEKEFLQCVFNNGRLFLNYKGMPITAGPGFNVSFLVSGKWYNSSQAQWQVRKEGDCKIEAVGLFPELNCTQVWEIEISESKIRLGVSSSSQDALFIEETCISIFLPEMFKHWFTESENGIFPEIQINNAKWDDVIQGDTIRQAVGVRSMDSLDEGCAELLFANEANGKHIFSQIFNTDYLAHARVLRFRIVGEQNNVLSKFTGCLLIGPKEVNKYLAIPRANNEVVLKNLKIKFEKGRCLIYEGALLITKSRHITFSLYANDIWFDSDSASWILDSSSKNKISARGCWPKLPVIATWCIESDGLNGFILDIDIIVKEDISIEKQFFRFEFSELFTGYSTYYGTGLFPDDFLDRDVDLLQKCISHPNLVFFSDKKELTPLHVKFVSGSGSFAKIFNSDAYSRARELRVIKVQPESKRMLQKGEHSLFKAEIRESDEAPTAINTKLQPGLLRNGFLSVSFVNGSIKIFSGSTELTKGLCLYSSFRSQGRWFDSVSSAIWNYELSGNKLKALGSWVSLPLKQEWNLDLTDEGTIELKIETIVNCDIEMDRVQTNLMILESYSSWFLGGKSGSFPDFSGDIDDDWQILSSSLLHDIDSIAVAVSGKNMNQSMLPGMKMLLRNKQAKGCLNVLNSDLYHRGRVLQYLEKDCVMLKPGRYLHYEGSILVGKI